MTNYTIETKDLLKGFNVDKDKGLSSEQVTLHRTKYGENKLLEKEEYDKLLEIKSDLQKELVELENSQADEV